MSRCMICDHCPEVEYGLAEGDPSADMYWDPIRSGYICSSCRAIEFDSISDLEDLYQDASEIERLDPTFDDMERTPVLERRYLEDSEENLE